VPFHVEVRRSFRHAWRFNLDAAELRRTVLEPWARGALVELGDQEWSPADTQVRILEGPQLDVTDLAHGQGWNRALRTAADVTREVLAAPARGDATAAGVAVVAATPERRSAASSLLRELGVGVADWAPVRAAILAGEPERAAVQAALVMVEAGGADAGFDAGLALGALGRRAVVVEGAPPRPEALAKRLSDAGVTLPGAGVRPQR
jgi:hypothetical protein